VTTLRNRIKTLAYRWYYRRMNRLAWEGAPSPEIKTSFLQLPLPEQTLGARMYHGSRHRPLIIYFHGGGWTIGDLDTHHPFCLRLADQTHCTIMSIDYRLAPEHPFPAAHEDAMAASRWIIDNLNALAPNNGEVVIAGDSAGGNLTLATAVRLPDEPRLRGCLMLYPGHAALPRRHALLHGARKERAADHFDYALVHGYLSGRIGAGRPCDRNHVSRGSASRSVVFPAHCW
jgi:acetyl esterase